MTFLAAMKTTFAKEGQTLKDFADEVKRLTPEDKAYFHREMNKAGITCDAPA